MGWWVNLHLYELDWTTWVLRVLFFSMTDLRTSQDLGRGGKTHEREDLGLTQENMNSRGPPSPLLSCVRIIHDPWLVTWIWLVSEMYITHIDRPGPQPIVPCLHHWPWIKFFFLEFKVNIAWVVMTSTTLPQLETNQPHPWVFQQESSSSIMTDLRDRLGGTPTLIPKSMTEHAWGLVFLFLFFSVERGNSIKVGCCWFKSTEPNPNPNPNHP